MAEVLRVFISSTSIDLTDHRARALDACLRQNMLPVMMEHLPAADGDAVDVSLKMVEESDIYLGIFGRRYGYVPTGYSTSITEMEYDHAVKLGLPRLIFIMDNGHPVAAAHVEGGEAAEKLRDLVARLKAERVVNFFDSPDKLLAFAINSLSHLRLGGEAAIQPRATATVPRVPHEVASDKFSDPIKEEMARLNKTIDKVTAEQYRVLDYLTGQRRVAITGCAGSGKTLIAVEKAIRLARAGLRTLVLCHNPYLADSMRRLARGEKVQVYDFAEWVGQLTGRGLQSDGTWNHYYWPTDDDLLDAAEMLTNAPERFDAVIVDEGQDFRDEWWLVVESALVNPQTDILYIFHDNNQALLPHQTKYPVAQSPIVLSQNCRNAGKIFEWVRQFHFRLEQNPSPELAELGIVHKTVFDPGREIDGVKDAVREALTVLSPDQLIVLTTEFSEVEQSILNGLRVDLRFARPWQEVIRFIFQRLANYFSHKDPMPELSDALTPTPDDLRTVMQYAKAIAQTPAARRAGRPEAVRVAHVHWMLDANDIKLSFASERRMLWFFCDEDWAEGLPVPRVVTLSASPSTSEDTVRLSSVSSYKGLEADGVILFVQSPRDKLRSNLYVGLSRARFLLHLVIDPASNSRLPALDAPFRRSSFEEAEGEE